MVHLQGAGLAWLSATPLVLYLWPPRGRDCSAKIGTFFWCTDPLPAPHLVGVRRPPCHVRLRAARVQLDGLVVTAVGLGVVASMVKGLAREGAGAGYGGVWVRGLRAMRTVSAMGTPFATGTGGTTVWHVWTAARHDRRGQDACLSAPGLLACTPRSSESHAEHCFLCQKRRALPPKHPSTFPQWALTPDTDSSRLHVPLTLLGVRHALHHGLQRPPRVDVLLEGGTQRLKALLAGRLGRASTSVTYAQSYTRALQTP